MYNHYILSFIEDPIVYEEAIPVMNGIETVYGDTMIDSTLINVINPTYGAPENGRQST